MYSQFLTVLYIGLLLHNSLNVYQKEINFSGVNPLSLQNLIDFSGVNPLNMQNLVTLAAITGGNNAVSPTGK